LHRRHHRLFHIASELAASTLESLLQRFRGTSSDVTIETKRLIFDALLRLKTLLLRVSLTVPERRKKFRLTVLTVFPSV
jgi:hypothetical protein